jgi:hypothetical protein
MREYCTHSRKRKKLKGDTLEKSRCHRQILTVPTGKSEFEKKIPNSRLQAKKKLTKK